MMAALISQTALGAPAALKTRPMVAPFLNGVLPEAAPDPSWEAVVAFPHLLFTNCVGLAPVPGTTNLLCAWEREGRVWIFTNSPESTTKRLAADLSARCQGWDDCGLLGFAFHPGFATNHYAFVYYPWVARGTAAGDPAHRPPKSTPVHNRLSRLTLDENGPASESSELVLIDQECPGLWHLGGGLMFKPTDGFLYLSVGDNSEADNNQRIDRALFSGVLRLDPDLKGGNVSHPIHRQPARGTTGHYFIPNDNPWVGQPGVLEEFYAIGLRSPYRMTFDPPSGRTFIGDVGDQLREEINVIEPGDSPGLNFQWNRIEGLQGDLIPPYPGVSKRPLLDYTHVDGQAVIGGYVYRGRAFAAELGGKYIFGDNVQRKIWALNESGGEVSKTLLCSIPEGPGPSPGPDYTGLSSFGLDQSGELYACQMSSVGGRVYKLARARRRSERRAYPPLLSLTGLLGKNSTSAGLIPYEVNSPLWSDGAFKRRWMALPALSAVTFSPTGSWEFPAGTVFVKDFALPLDEANPSARKRLETRLLTRDTNGGVYGITYKWRPDDSDADLLTNSLSETLLIALPPVGSFASAEVGHPAFGGSSMTRGNTVEIRPAAGVIGGNSDQFHFGWQRRRGDFDVQAEITGGEAAEPGAQTGLMARESLAPGSRHVFAALLPRAGAGASPASCCALDLRSVEGGETSRVGTTPPARFARASNVWLRLKRQGDLFTALASADSTNWALIAVQRLDLPPDLCFGPASAAPGAKAGQTTVFHFPATRPQNWYYPGGEDCASCHNRAAGFILGVNTRQLNGDCFYKESGASANQLRAWNETGLFKNPIQERDFKSFDRLVPVADATAPLEARVRSYLDANCAQCHRPGGAPTLWDARFDTPLAAQRVIAGDVYFGDGVPGAKVVAPGRPSQSILYLRLSSADAIKMPPLSKNVIDEGAVAVFAEWISGLPAAPSAAKDH